MTGPPDPAETSKAPTQAAPEKHPCTRCGSLRLKGQYRRVDGQVVCYGKEAEAYCRQRVLSEQLGIELFTRYPRHRTKFEMDCRPADAKKGRYGWKSIFTDDDRVMAGWIYYSWCYPVGLAYAVQLDADNDLMKDYQRSGEFVEMTHEALAVILGMPRQSITRATGRLVARKMLRVEDGRTYPVAMPQITDEEREAANEADVAALGEAPNTIPRKYRHLLNDLLRNLPEEGEAAQGVREQIEAERAEFERSQAEAQEKFTGALARLAAEIPQGCSRTDALSIVLGSCTGYNDEHKGIRTVRDFVIEQVCSRIASLLSRAIIFRASSSRGTPEASGSPSSDGGGADRDDDATTPNELYEPGNAGAARDELREAAYAAGLGDRAMQKLPPRDELPALLIHAHMQRALGDHLVDLVLPAAIWAAAKLKGWTAPEVCIVLNEKAAAARKANRPAKFLESCVHNVLITPGALEQIRKRAGDAAAQAVKDEEWRRAQLAEQSVAALREAAYEARKAAMTPDDWEGRVARSMKRLAAEAKAAKPNTERLGKPKESEWSKWQNLPQDMRRKRAETAAERELREEMDSEGAAGGGR